MGCPTFPFIGQGKAEVTAEGREENEKDKKSSRIDGVGVSSKHQRVNLEYCVSGSDGVVRGHEVYTGSGRMSLRLVRCFYSC